jgi:hypothetical protein
VVEKNFLLVLFFLSFSLVSYPQGWLTEENNFETNWNITFQLGPTILITEMKKDFSGAGNDMNNQSNIGFSFQLAKMVWERVDIGFEFGNSKYKGYRENPSKVNYLMLSGYYNNKDVDFQPFPIYYNSNVSNFTLFTKYNFINFNSFEKGFIKLNLYTKFGFGVVFISSVMGYRNLGKYEITGLSNPLFVIGHYPNAVKNSHISISPSFGMNYQLSDRFFISVESGFQFINADYIDGIYNFNDKLTPEVEGALPNDYRVQVYEMTGKFLLGVTYFFNFDSSRKIRGKAFPWYNNRYRSYYSKFQTPSTKKAMQERLPFYNIKFDELN